MMFIRSGRTLDGQRWVFGARLVKGELPTFVRCAVGAAKPCLQLRERMEAFATVAHAMSSEELKCCLESIELYS